MIVYLAILYTSGGIKKRNRIFGKTYATEYLLFGHPVLPPLTASQAALSLSYLQCLTTQDVSTVTRPRLNTRPWPHIISSTYGVDLDRKKWLMICEQLITVAFLHNYCTQSVLWPFLRKDTTVFHITSTHCNLCISASFHVSDTCPLFAKSTTLFPCPYNKVPSHTCVVIIIEVSKDVNLFQILNWYSSLTPESFSFLFLSAPP